ncbi:4885_t:CDS:2, partial [Scutellospora calospora]
VRVDRARVVRVELDVALRVVVAKVRDDLIRSGLSAAVRAASGHHKLRGGRRDVDDALRAAGGGRGDGHELAHDVEEAEDVDAVALSHGLGRDVFGRLVAVVANVARGAGDEDVDFAYGLQDFGDAREVGLRGDVGLDFGVGVRLLEACLCGGEDAFAALEDDDAGDAGFGEGLADGVADASRWEEGLALRLELGVGGRDTVVGFGM